MVGILLLYALLATTVLVLALGYVLTATTAE
jgi:hypothetical protein